MNFCLFTFIPHVTSVNLTNICTKEAFEEVIYLRSRRANKESTVSQSLPFNLFLLSIASLCSCLRRCRHCWLLAAAAAADVDPIR